MVGADIKLPIFNGNRLEDLEQHWILYEAYLDYEADPGWEYHKAKMIMTLRGHALDWYMKFSIVPVKVVPKTLNEIWLGFIDEFKKVNYESKCIIEIKEIKHLPIEYVWDFNQRFKTLMAKVSFQLLDVKHKEWFIITLLPHIWTLLMQQKLVSPIEALEITMKLEASPVGDSGSGMMQIQS